MYIWGEVVIFNFRQFTQDLDFTVRLSGNIGGLKWIFIDLDSIVFKGRIQLSFIHSSETSLVNDIDNTIAVNFF